MDGEKTDFAFGILGWDVRSRRSRSGGFGMPFDISKFSSPGQTSGRYQKRLASLRNSGRETTCIERAVEDAARNIKEGSSRSFIIYGEPQSGKTEMMIALTARLLDDGHKIIIHLLNDNVSLLDQNLYRFQSSGLTPCPCNYADILDPVIQIADKEWVVFCKKNGANLRKLLEKVGHHASKVVIDDEADYASPNGKINEGEQTPINELIENLLGERGIYIGVTATPARLNLNSTFENDHTKWVEFPAHKKYTGQDIFFPLAHSYEFKINFIPDGAGDDPKWCRDALFGFLVNVAHLNVARKGDTQNYSFLVHTSGKKADHKKDYQTIQKIFGALSDPKNAEYASYVEKLWTIADSRYGGEADAITRYVLENIASRNVVVMNSAKEFEKNHKSATSPSTTFTIVIGGNIVSRGMTFDNLLAMYFTRDVKHRLMQDTYIQRARMFGTRNYVPHFELTIPETLYLDWHRCFIFHRLSLETVRSGQGAPVWMESGRIGVTAPPSIDRAHVDVDAGEMGFRAFDYDSIAGRADDVLSIDTSNLEKLAQLQRLLGDDHFPPHVLSYIRSFSNGVDGAIMLHKANAIAGMSDADQESITRRKGFMGGAAFTGNPQVMHHLRILYNASGKGRLFYKYTGKVKFLRNLKGESKLRAA